MKNHAIAITPFVPSFESLLDKMTPHFQFFAKRVLRLKGDDLDDALQELSCIAFDLYRALVEKGKQTYFTPLMEYAILRYNDGRRFNGSNSVDAMSEQTRNKGRSKINREDALYFIADRKTNVAKSVGFKIDFDDWYHKQTPKDKDIIHDLAMGETPSDIARKHGQSPASITYRRQYYAKNWKDYEADNWQGNIA
jgi:hypothetical protein